MIRTADALVMSFFGTSVALKRFLDLKQFCTGYQVNSSGIL